MLTVSIKSKKPIRILIVLFALACAITVFIVFTVINSSPKKQITIDGFSYNTEISSENDLVKFLTQFGWEAESAPVEVSKIIIPSTFNDVYEKYNEIQLNQGLDLTDYQGKSCIKYTLRILNHSESDEVCANIIVYEGYVIGGDISEDIMDGFMTGLLG